MLVSNIFVRFGAVLYVTLHDSLIEKDKDAHFNKVIYTAIELACVWAIY